MVPTDPHFKYQWAFIRWYKGSDGINVSVFFFYTLNNFYQIHLLFTFNIILNYYYKYLFKI
jgi:hypothetical protein